MPTALQVRTVLDYIFEYIILNYELQSNYLLESSIKLQA